MGGRGSGGSRGTAFNKQNEYAGEYTIYRAGDLTGGVTGQVYFAAGEKESAMLHAEVYSGRYGRKHIYNEYKVTLNNPLVITAVDDESVMVALYNKLHRTNYYFSDFRKILKNKKQKTDRSSIQKYIDSENAKAMSRQNKYDGVIYKTETNTILNKDGEEIYKGGGPQISQIILSKKKVKSVQFIAQHKRKPRKKKSTSSVNKSKLDRIPAFIDKNNYKRYGLTKAQFERGYF